MRKAHPHGVQGRRPVAPKYKRALKEKKIEEIRLVNRAKWLLIECLGMKESDAHRYIEKQAMDLRISKSEMAENIIRTYKG